MREHDQNDVKTLFEKPSICVVTGQSLALAIVDSSDLLFNVKSNNGRCRAVKEPFGQVSRFPDKSMLSVVTDKNFL